MATNSAIEWTQITWNPISGCDKCSPGCEHCYALRMSHRLGAMGQLKYQGTTRKSGSRTVWSGKLFLDWSVIDLPKSWKSSKLVFVNSMPDLFHEDVPLRFIRRVFETMEQTPQHTYQVLTKRAQRLSLISSQLPWPNNVWMGVSVENEDYIWRIDRLRESGAVTKFLSLEPLLGPLDELNLYHIDWVIAGGESGPGARSVDAAWVRKIRDQCVFHQVPFFFKQWGGINKKKTGRILDGRVWDEMPPMIPRHSSVAVNLPSTPIEQVKTNTRGVTS